MNGIIWRPTNEFLENSHVARFMRVHGCSSYEEFVQRSTSDIEWFWTAALQDMNLAWDKPYDTLLDQSRGIAHAHWCIGGRINIARNCIDRHLPERASEIAIIWDGDDGTSRTLTYQELNDNVNRLANLLRAEGVQPGECIGIFIPMVSEVVVAMFACLKIGAIAVPVFSGFGPEALATRLSDARVRVLLTADGGFRRGKVVPIKPSADAAAVRAGCVERVIVLKHANNDVEWNASRDIWWHEATERQSKQGETAQLDAEAIAMLLYTSGTTGKPKGTVHTHIGCLAQMGKELRYAFDVRPGRPFFWFTDIGWMMGPWEMIGVLLYGGTIVLAEGAPDFPHAGRMWEMVQKYRIDTLGIAPTAIRLLMRSGDEVPKKYDLSSLRLLGSTGEPWDTESYMWFFEHIGGRRCPIINISGGTEIVGCLLSPLPICELKPCTLRGPSLGMDVDVFDDAGQPVRGGIGHLVCKQPAPSMTKGFWNDEARYLDTYFSKFPDVWYHGDWAKIDEDGFWFLYGRSDDTIKVAGKRVGPAEVEAALIEHASVSEAAAIGVPHDVKGESIVCFVVLAPTYSASDVLRSELMEHVAQVMGKTLKPEVVKFVEMLPKTRSAKIVRGAIRKVYLGEDPGDISSVEHPAALAAIRNAQ